MSPKSVRVGIYLIYSRRWPGADVGLRESWWSLDRERNEDALAKVTSSNRSLRVVGFGPPRRFARVTRRGRPRARRTPPGTSPVARRA